jgi:glycerol-3-phosphate dehydrogenase
MMIVPWNGLYLVGTTDLRYAGDPGEVRTRDDEIAYLLREANQLIPSAGLTTAEILYTYSGVRPLPFTPDGAEGAITRRHIIKNHAPKLRGLYSIIGGKLTTYRSLAEEAIDRVCEDLGVDAQSITADMPLPGAGTPPSSESEVPPSTMERLAHIYGSRTQSLLNIANESRDLLEPFDPDTGAIGAEVVFAAREEMAITLEDILMRRTIVGLGPRMAIGTDLNAAEIAQRHLGWDQARADREVDAYRAYLERFRPLALREVATT